MLRPLVSVSGCRPWELTWCFSWLIYSISHVSSSLLLFTPLICLSSLSSANPSNLHPVHALTLSDFLGDFWPWVWVLVLGSKRRGSWSTKDVCLTSPTKGFWSDLPRMGQYLQLSHPGYIFQIHRSLLGSYLWMISSILTKGLFVFWFPNNTFGWSWRWS